MKKGISLIVLVITIIVIVVLSQAVILSLANNNPINKATEASFKSNYDTYNSELAINLAMKYADSSNFNPSSVNATVWDGNLANITGTIKEYVSSISTEDASKYGIMGGKIVYLGNNSTEKSYMTFNTNDVEYAYTGSYQTFKAPIDGTYILETWGASGGGDNNQAVGSHKGFGGYAKGEINLTKGQMLYIYVGSEGKIVTLGQNLSGGYNGGGIGSHNNGGCYGFGGGGATDIRTISGVWDDVTSLNSRLIVAGGGGGADNLGGVLGGNDDGSGGNGGGLTAENARINGVYSLNTGATQTTGVFGKGQNANQGSDTGGGGGGYYGGICTNNGNGGAGGGSSYLGTLTNSSTTSGINNGNGKAKIALKQ